MAIQQPTAYFINTMNGQVQVSLGSTTTVEGVVTAISGSGALANVTVSLTTGNSVTVKAVGCYTSPSTGAAVGQGGRNFGVGANVTISGNVIGVTGTTQDGVCNLTLQLFGGDSIIVTGTSRNQISNVISAQASTTHIVTANEILTGFAVVPIVWDFPFADAGYDASYSIDDLDNVLDLSFVTGDVHNKTANGFNAIVYMAMSPILIQQQLNQSHVSTIQTMSDTAPVDTLYAIQYYVTGYAGGDAAVHVGVTFNWTDAQGAKSVTLATAVTGANAGADQGTYNLVAIAGSAISVSFAWSGTPGSPSYFTVNSRMVRTPNNVSIDVVPGDMFTVRALATHQ